MKKKKTKVVSELVYTYILCISTETAHGTNSDTYVLTVLKDSIAYSVVFLSFIFTNL